MKNRYIIKVAFVLLYSALAAQENPKHLFLQAREMQQTNGGNNSAGAIALYRKVIAALPNSSEAYLRLSEALLEVQNIDGALVAAKKAVELSPKNSEAAVNLAIIEFAIAKQSGRNADTAKAALLRAAKLSPSDPELWFRLADLCESTHDSTGALNAWLHLGGLRPAMSMGDQPVFIVAYERATYLAYTLKLYKERREACIALARESGATEKHLRFLEDLAREQVEQGYLGHAEESFTLLAKRFPGDPSVWQNIALVQRQTDRFADAIQSLQKAQAIMSDPRNILQQAYCLMNLGRLLDAHTILQNLLSQPNFSEQSDLYEYARTLLSACLLMLNRSNDLLQLMKYWTDTPENSLLSGQRAHALLQVKDFKTARIALKEGLRHFPEQLIFKRTSAIPNNIFEGGSIYENESRKALKLIELETSAYLLADFRQWDKCLEIIQEIHKLTPTHDVEILLLQSNALESLSHGKEALDILRQCQRIAPAHSTVQNNLGYHLLEFGGDIQEAASLIKAALDQKPDDASYQDSWGWALFKQGKFTEAEAILQNAVEANPLNPEIRKHLGDVLLNLSRPQEALDQ
jgi:tetratricopeptide (TPR) repeat protein